MKMYQILVFHSYDCIWVGRTISFIINFTILLGISRSLHTNKFLNLTNIDYFLFNLIIIYCRSKKKNLQKFFSKFK